jgi:putative FmdB family regulatory protein
MPTYEFRCVDCGNRVEIFQRIGEAPLEVCEVCGGRLRKVFHPAGIVFKGSGFYSTDSRRRAPSGGDGQKGSSESTSKNDATSKKDGSGKKDGAKEAAS